MTTNPNASALPPSGANSGRRDNPPVPSAGIFEEDLIGKVAFCFQFLRMDTVATSQYLGRAEPEVYSALAAFRRRRQRNEHADEAQARLVRMRAYARRPEVQLRRKMRDAGLSDEAIAAEFERRPV